MNLKNLVLSCFLLFSNSSFSQEWVNIEYGDKPIPVKFFKTSSISKSPAILLVHGTAGPSYREDQWGEFLSQNGFNVLVVDFKSGRFTGPNDRHKPFYPSLIEKTHDWLKKQPNVDTRQISYMGFSLGGFLGFRLDSTTEFKNYIMFYPGCYNLNRIGNSYMVEKERVNPTLVVWGDLDAYGEGTYCPEIIQKMKGNFSWLSIKGAGHGFDGDKNVGFFDSASPSGFARVEPNSKATKISQVAVLQFLQDKN